MSTDTQSIERRVAEIIVNELKLEEVTPDTFDVKMDLIDELGIDSMDLTAVVLVLQDEWKITIYEEDYPKLKTVERIAGYIHERLSKPN
jgi:acyl carrier protein